MLRKEIFSRNYLHFEEHNSQPGVTYMLGINQFSDLTEEQIGLLSGAKEELESMP